MKPLLMPILLAVFTLASHAERAPRPPVLTAPAPAEPARVIVKFKSDAATVRARALAATAGADAVALALGERASVLGGRVGVSLKAGQAVGERTQVVIADGLTSAQLAARLQADSDVEYAEPDRRMTRQAVPIDPFFLSRDASVTPDVGQWFLRAPVDNLVSAINATRAWDTSKGSGVVVAVLDTGVRADHPDLAGKLVKGYDMVADTDIANDGNGREDDASDPGDWVSSAEANTGKFSGCPQTDSSWHGTQVAGIVGAQTDNGVGVAGTGWNVTVQPVRVLGKCYGNESDIAAGILWAAGIPVAGTTTNATPAKVINLSLGGTGSCDRTYQDAINAAVAKGVTVVVAAGNSAGHAVGAPGNCLNVVTVGALRHVGTKVGYSDVGPQVTLSAPGGNCFNDETGPCLYPIITTDNDGTTVPGASTYSDYRTHVSVGTSFSSPQVAATAALMLAKQAALTPSIVKAVLQQSARAFPTSVPAGDTAPAGQCRAPNGTDQLECYCTTSTCGAGMLDAGAAVALAAEGPVATIAVSASTAAPTVGTAVTLTAAVDAPAARQPLTTTWAVLDGGAVASLASNGSTATLSTTGAGTVVVQATVADALGFTTSTTQTITVSAETASSGGGGGGGALSFAWLALLAVASLALHRLRPAA